jgi:hypothetical protein
MIAAANEFKNSVPRCLATAISGRLHSTVSGGSSSRRKQLYWFAEADDCSDDNRSLVCARLGCRKSETAAPERDETTCGTLHVAAGGA